VNLDTRIRVDHLQHTLNDVTRNYSYVTNTSREKASDLVISTWSSVPDMPYAFCRTATRNCRRTALDIFAQVTAFVRGHSLRNNNKAHI